MEQAREALQQKEREKDALYEEIAALKKQFGAQEEQHRNFQQMEAQVWGGCSYVGNAGSL